MLKKLHLKLALLLTAMVMGAGNVWGEEKTWTHAFASPEAISNGAITVNEVTWEVSTTSGAGSPSMTTGTYSKTYGLKFGNSKSEYYGSVTFTTNYFSGYNVKSVSINVLNNASKAGTLSAQQGSTTIGSASQTFGTSWTNLTVNTNRGSGGDLSFTYTVQQAFFIHSITVVYETPDVQVPVTGISLDKSAITLEVDETITLKPTIAPADATNKKVTWESDDTDVATVDNGVVTGVGAGTATITATTEDGNKTASCEVTVKAAKPSFTLDFTSNDWGIPVGTTKTTGTHTYTNTNGVTITLNGPTGNGYYYDANHLFMGKQGASLTLPVFSFNVSKIKVYGTDAASSSVTFNIFVDDEPVSDEVTSAKEPHTFDIAADKQASRTEYTLKVTNGNNTRISKIEVFGYDNVPVGPAGFATYCSPNALDFSDVTGLKAYQAVMMADGKTVNFSKVDKVPDNTGVLVEGAKGAENTYKVPVVDSSSTDVIYTDVSNNKLVGVTEEKVIGMSSDKGTHYVLKQIGENVGFYKVNNAAYKVRANSAYLALTVSTGSTGAKDFIPVDGTTAIDLVDTANEVAAPVYNLQGQRVGNGYKGVVIVNGKKVIR